MDKVKKEIKKNKTQSCLGIFFIVTSSLFLVFYSLGYLVFKLFLSDTEIYADWKWRVLSSFLWGIAFLVLGIVLVVKSKKKN